METIRSGGYDQWVPQLAIARLSSEKIPNMTRRQRLLLECLEPRFLLATASFADGVVRIEGTEANDTLQIRQEGEELIVDGSSFRVSSALVQRIDAFLYGGDDTLLNATEIPLHAHGGGGDDVLTGGTGIDRLFGDDGNDQLNGKGQFADLLDGGAGDDVLEGFREFDFKSGAGSILTLHGTPDNDRFVLRDFVGVLHVNQVAFPWGNRYIHYLGLGGDDLVFNATNVRMTIWGGEGHDRLIGGSREDNLFGEAGNDVLLGNAGNDLLDGGAGDDLMWGQLGDDTFRLLSDEVGHERDLMVEAANQGRDALELSQDHRGVSANLAMARGEILQLRRTSFFLNSAPEVIRLGDGNDQVMAIAGVLEIHGGGGNDFLVGGEGRQLLRGGSGNDTLVGGGGDDALLGDAGDDTLLAGDGIDSLQGGEGNDLLDGGQGNDTLHGLAGNDVLRGGDQDDRLFGGDGRDILEGGDGNDVLDGEKGDDQLSGGYGIDRYEFSTASITAELDSIADPDEQNILDLSFSTDAVTVDLRSNDAFATVGKRTIARESGGMSVVYGGSGNDYLRASSAPVHFEGRGGMDFLEGGAGNDVLIGGTGPDSLYGFAGNDTLIGEDGNDFLYGDTGFDQLSGGTGNDRLQGGTEDDILEGGDGNDSLDGGQGVDTYRFATAPVVGEFDLIVEEDDGNFFDLLNNSRSLTVDLNNSEAFAIDDRRTITRQGGRFNKIYTGAGNDTIIGTDASEEFHAGAGDDFLDGRGGDDKLEGYSGNDVILAGDGNDEIDAGTGNDEVRGGAGDDVIIAGFGDDLIFGEDGNDLIYGIGGKDWIDGGAGNDTIWADNPFQLSSGGSVIVFPDEVDDILYGGDGDDFIHGGNGNDRIFGGSGDDTLNGGWQSDELYGNEGNDKLFGLEEPVFIDGEWRVNDGYYFHNGVFIPSDGDDILRGGAGEDELTGARGVDELYGEEGDDILHSDDDDIIVAP